MAIQTVRSCGETAMLAFAGSDDSIISKSSTVNTVTRYKAGINACAAWYAHKTGADQFGTAIIVPFTDAAYHDTVASPNNIQNSVYPEVNGDMQYPNQKTGDMHAKLPSYYSNAPGSKFSTTGGMVWQPFDQTDDVTVFAANSTVFGTTETVLQTYAHADSWLLEQALLCSKPHSVKLTLFGVETTRYHKGTPACDSVMSTVCTMNTSIIKPRVGTGGDQGVKNDEANWLHLSKACRCIRDQKRLEARYASSSLPIQCFSSVCGVAHSPGVYASQTQMRGCSAKLCQQVLRVHGDDMLVNGHQQIFCGDQQYNVSDYAGDNAPNPADKEDIRNAMAEQLKAQQQENPIVTPVFVLALGFMVMALGLLVLYFVLRWREGKAQRAQKADTAAERIMRNLEGQ